MISRARKEALELAEGLLPSANNIQLVAGSTELESARWAFSQWAIRKKGESKFALAREMFFTQEALEQASHEQVARYHASKFPEGALVADLTTGIGGDLIAIASRGPAVGFELDAERIDYAQNNLKAYGLSDVQINPVSCLEAKWDFEFAFCDPGRRIAGKKSINPDDFQPNPIELSARLSALKLAGMKLSPMLEDYFLESFGGELEFVSYGRECRESLIWLGSQANKSSRWAVHVESGSRIPASDHSVGTTEMKKFLFEADPAAIRAHALGTLCGDLGVSELGDSNGYLTGEKELNSPWLATFEILCTMKYHPKLMREFLVKNDLKIGVIKMRGTHLQMQEIEKDLKKQIDRSSKLVLFLWPIGKSIQASLGYQNTKGNL